MANTVASTATPTMNRARSEADRWRLVREFETSFKNVAVTPPARGADQATVLSSSGSWFQRRGSNTAQVDNEEKTSSNMTSKLKTKQMKRVVSNYSKQSYKIDDRFFDNVQSTTAAPPIARSRSSSRRFVPAKAHSKATPKQRKLPVEYDLADFAKEQSRDYRMRTPSPAALPERKASFFGRVWFTPAQAPAEGNVEQKQQGVNVGNGFEPMVPQQSTQLPRQKSGFFGRSSNNNTKPSVLQQANGSSKQEAAVTAPPLIARSSSIFTKLFPRKLKAAKRLDALPTMTTLPASPQVSDNDNQTESEGSYDFDEEIAMASTSSSHDFPLPETLLSESQQKQRVTADDFRNPVDRWSPSPVPDHVPETHKQMNLTSFIDLPKRPVRQQSLKHDFDEDEFAACATSNGGGGVSKSNLLQERQELMQQMKRVDHLLQGLIHDDDAAQSSNYHHASSSNNTYDDTESKTNDADTSTPLIVVPPQPPQRQQSHEYHHDDSFGYGTDDDSSTYSMLSGIMASWMAERDKAAPPKSICKTTPNKTPLSVRFDRIHVREYERVVGDNPSCSSGPPISIGWNFLPAQDYAIDEYETRRGSGRTRREFYLAPGKRTDLLLQDWNCRPEDIRKARRDATYIQYCREKSGSASGKSSKMTEAAFLRKANRKLQKNHPDVSDDSLEPPCVPTRPGSPFCDSPPISVPVQPSRQPSVAKLVVVMDDRLEL
ncbi:hypothetical protein MPSEU_000306800 [Mayamaea pseudoterrestris]|nr:hypothetical protein MPSEU_000306800 [Mayamaea pseudoterrestris]